MPSGSRTRNPVSIAGAWITTVSAFAFIAYYIAESLGLMASPYAGILGFVVIPGVFLLGLLLIPLGMYREARRRRQGLAERQCPAIDLARAPASRDDGRRADDGQYQVAVTVAGTGRCTAWNGPVAARCATGR